MVILDRTLQSLLIWK